MIADSLIDGRYRQHEQVGSSGMGVVWRATDELLSRQVAIKRLRLDGVGGDPAEVTRLRMFARGPDPSAAAPPAHRVDLQCP